MTTDKKTPDWECIEFNYRAGVLSIRQIAQEFGVSDGAIRKRAKKDDWQRDLRKKIDDKADAIVRSEVVRTKFATEKETIDANASLVAHIRLTHRKDIAKARTLTMTLFDELEHIIGIDKAQLLEQLGDLLYKPDEKGMDKLNDLYMKIIQLPNRVKVIKELGDALKTVIGLEREAFGLNKESEQIEDAFTTMLNRIAQGNSSTFKPVDADPEYN